ncbi:MAG: S41 family peptidase [Bacteroidales bacterium]|nr:S41 family peptidase [Bacteroidales bacterium]
MVKRISLTIALLALSFGAFAQSQQDKTSRKMLQLMYFIDNLYVDTVDMPVITEKGMVSMLKELDPHSVYIPQKDVKKANEPLQGNIEGIGVTYQLVDDTIHVVDVVADGPSEKVGMLPGDRIIKVNDTAATGDSINADWVASHLRGKKGSVVKVTVDRRSKGNIDFRIVRDKIPLNSIDTWFMVDDQIGYISLRRFSQTSDSEFKKAVEELTSQGMKKLIFDLRSNGGGYLDAAQKIVDEFISDDKLIVYTQGVKSPRQELKAGKKGVWEKGDLVILTDEYTASASEITSGAVQDWDRGVIIGRRTFGKGLVQRPMNMVDGSQVRLTTSRYYIPSGRCIQKPYDDGVEEYYRDYQKRYQHKEMVSADSISFPDSLKYKTNNGRTVYGGGGIMPDIFIPMDTSRASDYFINLRSKNVFNEFALSWTELHRNEMLASYPKYEDFDAAWESLHLMKEFEDYAASKGVKPTNIKPQWINNIIDGYLKQMQNDSLHEYSSYSAYADSLLTSGWFADSLMLKAKEEDLKQQEYINSSNAYIEANLKGNIARNLYGIKYYYKAVQQNDETVQQAVKLLRDEKRYKSILKKSKH